MEQQENQYNIETNEKSKTKIFFTGMFWGFIVGGILLLSAGFMYLVNMINVKTNKVNNIDFEQLQKDQTESLRLQKKAC